MRSRLGNLQLYKFDVPYHSDVGVILVTQEHGNIGAQFQLTRYTGRRHDGVSKFGLHKSFLDLLGRFFFFTGKDSNITNQICTYLASKFSFKDLEIVPPACPVLVFHFHIRDQLHHQDPVPHNDIAEDVMFLLDMDEIELDLDDVGTRLVPIAPTATKIVDCYRGQDFCVLCQKGYPKEDEIVYKTLCNHIFMRLASQVTCCVLFNVLVAPRICCLLTSELSSSRLD